MTIEEINCEVAGGTISEAFLKGDGTLYISYMPPFVPGEVQVEKSIVISDYDLDKISIR